MLIVDFVLNRVLREGAVETAAQMMKAGRPAGKLKYDKILILENTLEPGALVWHRRYIITSPLHIV